MSTQAIVCDSSVIRGMSNDPRNICYHYRHHFVGKQVYHCEISYSEFINSLIADCQISRRKAESLFTEWRIEFKSQPLSHTKEGTEMATAIQSRLFQLAGLIPEKTVKNSRHDCLIAGETIAQRIPELAAHDRDFLIIEVVCGGELGVVMLEMSQAGHPIQKKLSSQHKQRLEERLELAGIDLGSSIAETS